MHFTPLGIRYVTINNCVLAFKISQIKNQNKTSIIFYYLPAVAVAVVTIITNGQNLSKTTFNLVAVKTGKGFKLC